MMIVMIVVVVMMMIMMMMMIVMMMQLPPVTIPPIVTATTVGCLSLILESLSQLFTIVDYQLLPLSSIHKPIAKLISVASRYDAMITQQSKSDGSSSSSSSSGKNNNNNSSIDNAYVNIDNVSYKRRVGKLQQHYHLYNKYQHHNYLSPQLYYCINIKTTICNIDNYI